MAEALLKTGMQGGPTGTGGGPAMGQSIAMRMKKQRDQLQGGTNDDSQSIASQSIYQANPYPGMQEAKSSTLSQSEIQQTP